MRWLVLCTRCGGKEPTLHSYKVGEREWDRYVQTDMREAWLCEPCFTRIKRVVDARSRR